mgnify:CR=1 FL=1
MIGQGFSIRPILDAHRPDHPNWTRTVQTAPTGTVNGGTEGNAPNKQGRQDAGVVGPNAQHNVKWKEESESHSISRAGLTL